MREVSDSRGGPHGAESQPELAAPVSAGERALGALLHEAHLAAPHDVPGLLERHAGELGARDAVAYLADLQQNVLVPFLGPLGPAVTRQVEALEVEGTLAGRAFQHVEVLTQDVPGQGIRVWLPMLDGTERLGVLAVTVSDEGALEDLGGLLRTRLLRYASLAADVIMTKTLYGDTIVRLRRRQEMGLAAEMQWGSAASVDVCLRTGHDFGGFRARVRGRGRLCRLRRRS